MKIRPAAPSDLPDIRALHVANWRAEYRDDLSAEALGPALDLRMAEVWATIPEDEIVLVAEGAGGAFLGFVRAQYDDPDAGYVDALHVAEAARGLGAGKALMSEAARRVAARGARALTLNVMDANMAARGFYRRLGGVESAVREDRLMGEAVRARTLRWDNLQALAALG